MTEPDHYAQLGVPADAGAAEIRRAYLTLARQHHPDRLGEASPQARAAAAGRMAAVNAAWSVLSDPTRRAVYDLQRTGPRPAGSPHGATIREAAGDFRPLDDGPDPSIDLDDTPLGATRLSRPLTFLPILLGATGVGVLFFGLLLGFALLSNLGLLLLVASGLSFGAIPLVAMINSSRADRLD